MQSHKEVQNTKQYIVFLIISLMRLKNVRIRIRNSASSCKWNVVSVSELSALNYRPSFRENQPKRLVFSHRKRAFGIVFAKTGSINSGTGVCWKPFIFTVSFHTYTEVPFPLILSGSTRCGGYLFWNCGKEKKIFLSVNTFISTLKKKSPYKSPPPITNTWWGKITIFEYSIMHNKLWSGSLFFGK